MINANYMLHDRVADRKYYYYSYSAAVDMKVYLLDKYRTAGVCRVLHSPHYSLKIYALNVY